MTVRDDSGRRHSRSWRPLLVMLIPVLAGLAAQAAGSRPREFVDATIRPPLAFHQSMVDLGLVDAQPMHVGVFHFTNRSRDVVDLRDVKVSCGCLSPRLSQRQFQPGESGEIALFVQSANQNSGPKEFTCTVKSGPADKPEVSFQTELLFRVELPEKSVTIEPRSLLVHQPGGGVIEHPVVIRDLREKPLHVIRAESNVPFVEAEPLSMESLTEAEREEGLVSRVMIRISDVPPGRHEVTVRIETDDESYRLIKLPVRVTGVIPEPGPRPAPVAVKKGDQ